MCRTSPSYFIWSPLYVMKNENCEVLRSLCSGAHPASYTMGTGGKARPGRDADHSPPSTAEVEKE
jgi:hypothetical protein